MEGFITLAVFVAGLFLLGRSNLRERIREGLKQSLQERIRHKPALEPGKSWLLVAVFLIAGIILSNNTNDGTYFGLSVALCVIVGVLSMGDAPPKKRSTTFGDARWAEVFEDRDTLREVLTPKGVFLGGMITSSDDGDAITPMFYGGPRHLITVAPNRTGKGTCAIIPNLLTLEHSVIVIDPKGENAAITARRRRAFGPVHLLNPFNEHGLGSARFNPLAHLSIDSPNLVADVRGLAEALIISDSTQTYFSDTARTLVNVIMLHLVATKGGKASKPGAFDAQQSKQPLFFWMDILSWRYFRQAIFGGP